MPTSFFDWSRFAPRLDIDLTGQQIQTMGDNVLWRKSTVCPNRMLVKQNHDLNCKLCDGRGFLFDAGTEIKAGFTSISVKQMWQTWGRFDVGTVMVTTPNANKLSWWDKLEHLDATIRYSEIIQRPTYGLEDKLKYVAIDVARLVDSLGKDYECGVDFTIPNGKVLWAAGLAPANESFYSISYTCHPHYIVLELPHQIRQKQATTGGRAVEAQDFPVMAVAKLEFLIEDESKTT